MTSSSCLRSPAPLHLFSQWLVDSLLIALPAALQPRQHVCIHANRHWFLDRAVKFSNDASAPIRNFGNVRQVNLAFRTSRDCSQFFRLLSCQLPPRFLLHRFSFPAASLFAPK